MTKAFTENWILVSNDKDFGELVFREKFKHRGIILLRLEDERYKNKIEVLQRLIANNREKIPERFITVSENKIRFATP